jgi:hypothetical protein
LGGWLVPAALNDTSAADNIGITLKAGLEIAGESVDGWLQARKGWPREIDEWTHFMHGADGNCVANDTRVAAPRSMQWTSLSHWFRAACRYGLLPANGLNYNSPNPCECYVESKLNGFNALAPLSNSVHVADGDRLKIGPAFGQVAPSSAAADDWPAFRHDTRRSGSAGTALSAKFSKAWTLDLGGVPTGTVIASGLVHVAIPETRQLLAVDSVDGRIMWRVASAGQVDTPPTWHRGTIVDGTSDGYVVCRRASDGVLVWRFLAAASHRRVMDGGRLQSSWPVHGSVVVEGNRVYAVAGRSSFLDGGFSGWVLDAGTGKVIEEVRLDADSAAGSEGKVSSREGPGMTTDVLVGDGESLYLRGRTIFAHISTAKKTPLLRPTAGFLTGTWFNRVSHWKYGQASCGEAAITTDNLVFSFSAYPKRESPPVLDGMSAAGGRLFVATQAGELICLD